MDGSLTYLESSLHYYIRNKKEKNAGDDRSSKPNRSKSSFKEERVF